MRIHLWIVAAAVASSAMLQPAQAATLAVLNSFGDKIYLVDSGSAKLIDTLDLESLSGPVVLNSMAVVPGDGRLIGITTSKSIVEINASTGAAKTIATLGVGGLPPSSLACDPVEDECRLVSYFDAGQVTFNPGAGQPTFGANLKYKKGSGQPRVAGIAYTNTTSSAKKTELYDVDVATKTLYKQNGDAGSLAKVGKLGVNVDSLQVGFAISYNAKSKKNAGHLIFKKKLYTVDLKKGKAAKGKSVSGLPNEIKALAVLK